VGGSVPTQALKCKPLAQASTRGHYLFPPKTFGLRLDGTDVEWFLEGRSMGYLTGEPHEAVQYPGMLRAWDRRVPNALRGWSPPWIGLNFNSTIVQVWTGYVVTTAPGWHLQVGAPANLPGPTGVFHYQAIVPTDSYGGHLFVAIALTAHDRPVTFHRNRPFVQVVAVPQPVPVTVHMADFDDWLAAGAPGYQRDVIQRCQAQAQAQAQNGMP